MTEFLLNDSGMAVQMFSLFLYLAELITLIFVIKWYSSKNDDIILLFWCFSYAQTRTEKGVAFSLRLIQILLHKYAVVFGQD